MPDLFDAIEDSPFGSDSAREAKYGTREKERDLDELGGMPGVGRELDVKAKRQKNPDHNNRTRDYWTVRGWTYTRVDRYVSHGLIRVGDVLMPNGKTHDMLGLFDALAFKVGEPMVGIQICSVDGMQAHLRKAAAEEVIDDTGTSGDLSKKLVPVPDKTRVDIFRTWLACGFQSVLHGWEKPGREWVCKLQYVTEADIALVEKRRRKS